MSNKKGGSKFLTGLICFLLGFIIAIAAIAGVVCVGLFADLDTVLSLVGIDNTDEDGNYVYVNTDADNGGSTNLYQLLTALINYGSNYGDMTLGDLETLLPVTSSLTDGLVEFVDEFVDDDYDVIRDGLTSTKLSNLGSYVTDLVTSARVVTLLEKYAPDLMGDDATGAIVKAIVLGKQADYVTLDDGTTIPVYYDVYKPVYDSSGNITAYLRYTADENGDYTVEDTSAIIYVSNSMAGSLVPVYVETTDEETDGTESGAEAVEAAYLLSEEQGTETGTEEEDPVIDYCYLYYYTYNGVVYVTDGDFTYTTDTVYSFYDEDNATLSGNYYYDNDGNRVIVTSVTIGDLSDSQFITDSLDYVAIEDIMDAGDDDTITKVLSGYSVGDLISGKVDFDSVALTDVLTARPSNTAMVVILYNGVSAVKQDTTTAEWTCKYTDDDGVVHDAYIVLDDDYVIEHIYYYVTDEDGAGGYAYDSESGKYVESEGGGYTQMEVAATTIGEISTVVNTLELIAFMDPVEPDDALMMYIMYGVTGAEYDETKGWTASYNVKDDNGDTAETVEVTIDTYTNDEGVEVVSRVYYTDADGEDISTATTVNGASDVLNGLQDEFEIVALLDDVETDDAILIYISYKIKSVTAVQATDEQTGELQYDSEGNAVIDHYTGIYVDGDTEIVVTLKTRTETETVQTVIDTETVTILEGTDQSDGSTYYYYEDSDGNEVVVQQGTSTADDGTTTTYYYIESVVEHVYVTGAYYETTEKDEDGSEVTVETKVKGTTISQMSDRIDGIMNDLTLKELIGDVSDNKLLAKLGSATINTLSETINTLAIQEIYSDDIYTEQVTETVTVYKLVVSNDQVEGYDSSTMIAFADISGSTLYTLNEASEYVQYGSTFSNYSEMGSTSYYVAVDVTVTSTVARAIQITVISTGTTNEYTYYDGSTAQTITSTDLDSTVVTLNGVEYSLIAYNADYLYYYYDSDSGEYKLVDYDGSGNYLGKLTSTQYAELAATTTLYTYGEATGAWKFMLYGSKIYVYNEQGEIAYTYTGEEAYSINSISSLMNNVTRNIGEATLQELANAGIISENDVFSQTSNVYKDSSDASKGYKTVGELNISELLTYVSYLITQVNSQ